MDPTRIRRGFGLIVVVATWLLLSRLFPWETSTLTPVLARLTVFAVLACAAGGYVARQNFVVPATILALLLWIAVTAYSFYAGATFGDVSWDRLAWNLPNAILIPAAAVGAWLGTSAAVLLGESR